MNLRWRTLKIRKSCFLMSLMNNCCLNRKNCYCCFATQIRCYKKRIFPSYSILTSILNLTQQIFWMARNKIPGYLMRQILFVR